MFVEIPLIQKFILFLGQPLYAIATILSTLLISSGLGSLCAGRFSNEQARRGLLFVIFSLVVLLIIYIYLLPPVFNVFLGMQGMVRFLIAVILIIPLGMLMGIAFPMGIRLLENDGHAMIPWVWGINGACSVMGSIMAWGVSLNFGYNMTIWTAAAIYAAGFIIMACKPLPTRNV